MIGNNFLKEYAARQIEDFRRACNNPPPVFKTGGRFDSLEDALGGGIYPRFYVLGGDTSTGKTTFALQLADAIAQTGRTVAFFSQEMRTEEMIARSVSRISRETAGEDQRKQQEYCLAENEILYHQSNLPEKKRKAFEESLCIYQTKIKPNIIFFGGRRSISHDPGDPPILIENCSIYQVIEDIQNNSADGKPPIIFIDYLQILAPEPGTGKEIEKTQIDAHLREIMNLKTKFKTPIFAVSSYNRSSYKQTTGNAAALKGSGEIEYSADCLLFLEIPQDSHFARGTPKGEQENSRAEDYNKAMNKDTREIRIRITKNRGARFNEKLSVSYTPKYNYFDFIHKEEGTSKNEELKKQYKVKKALY